MTLRLLKILLVISVLISSALLYCLSPSVSSDEFPSEGIVKYSFSDQGDHTGSPLRLVTYNIGYASGIKNNKDKATEEETKKNLYEIALNLKKMNGDIVALQEVDFRSARTSDVNQMEYLAKFLNMPYAAYVVTWNHRYIPWPYWPVEKHFGRMLSGQALLSRYPITHQDIVKYAKPKNNAFWYNWFYLDRFEQKVTVELPQGTASIWSVHLEAFDHETRNAQASLLADAINNDSASIKFALGDFNSYSALGGNIDRAHLKHLEESPQALKTILEKTGLLNAEKESGLTLSPSGEVMHDNFTPILTMPSWNPIKKIDHILYALPFRLNDVGSISSVASDHRPVWAEFSK